VPPLQVRFKVPPSVATLHAPSHVMVQVPDEQVTFEPAPAVCVHDLPAQPMLQFAPQVPVQVAPDAHEKLQLAVDALQVSKPQVWSAAQAQLVPVQTVPQPVIASAITDNTTNTTRVITFPWYGWTRHSTRRLPESQR
jgi:hypothetical protein